MALTANELIEQALRTFLIADADITGIVGTRIFPIVALQNPPRDPNTGSVQPYAVYQRISTVRERNHDGAAGVARPRIQIDWIGSQAADGRVDYAQSLELAKHCRQALDGYTGTMSAITIQDVNLIDERDRYDEDLQRVGVQQDYLIWHREALS